MRRKKRRHRRKVVVYRGLCHSHSGLLFFCVFYPFFLFCFTNLSFLTEDDMAVKHRLSLFLDLPPPALLCVLHFVEHVGPRVWVGQNIVSVGKRLLVLKAQRGGIKWVITKKKHSNKNNCKVLPSICTKPPPHPQKMWTQVMHESLNILKAFSAQAGRVVWPLIKIR